MPFDYDKEEKTFIKELEEGKFQIERLPNKSNDYQQKEERDLTAFDNYLKSDSFKSLNTEASKE